MMHAKTEALGHVAFPTPSPSSLAFSLAFDAARSAKALRARVVFKRDAGKSQVEHATVPLLFAYFEQAMASAVFSFQCIEAYANQVISRLAVDPMEVNRSGRSEVLGPSDLERRLGTDDKLTQVLPRLLSVAAPKRTKAWPLYKDLKNVRDSAVHLKSSDHYVRGRVDTESVYYRLLNRRPLAFPETATKIITHYCGKSPERWLKAAKERLRTVR